MIIPSKATLLERRLISVIYFCNTVKEVPSRNCLCQSWELSDDITYVEGSSSKRDGWWY